jgi:hypothetical protein
VRNKLTINAEDRQLCVNAQFVILYCSCSLFIATELFASAIRGLNLSHGLLQATMWPHLYKLPVLILLCVPPSLLYEGAASSRHYPPEGVPTFQRDSVEWIPSYEKPSQRSAQRSSLTEHVFGTRALPLRAAVESIPRHSASYR